MTAKMTRNILLMLVATVLMGIVLNQIGRAHV